MGVGPGVLRFWGVIFGMGIIVLCGRWHLFAVSADRKGILYLASPTSDGVPIARFQYILSLALTLPILIGLAGMDYVSSSLYRRDQRAFQAVDNYITVQAGRHLTTIGQSKDLLGREQLISLAKIPIQIHDKKQPKNRGNNGAHSHAAPQIEQN